MSLKSDIILITGCAGFIGSKIASSLLECGNIVVGVDNLNTAYAPEIKQWRLEQIKKFPGFKFYQIDVTDIDKLRDLFQQYEFKGIMNLAARAGVRASIKDPWIYIQTNVVGTLNILELCKEFGVGKFILSSTSSIYGKNGMPFKEDSKTDYQISPYAASKKGAESLAYTYHHLYGIDITILRYFTVYGPAGRPDMAVLKIIHSISENMEIPIYGDGTQERDFTYIDDIARGTIEALKKIGFEIINLGSDRPMQLNYVINLIEEYLGKKAKIAYYPFHPADATSTWADISKAEKLLEWRPRISIEEGIKKTVSWYMENQSWISKIENLE